ncbi:MAG: tetratricopeptide repeat protein [bacterium]|nr:tetratricopeptide repeat protein [bacterium]
MTDWKNLKNEGTSPGESNGEDLLINPKLTPDQNVDAAIKMHSDCVNDGRREEAKRLAVKMAETFAANAEIQFYLGQYYRRKNDWENSGTCFERALHMEPDNADYQFAVGWHYLHTDKLRRAAEIFAYMNTPSHRQDIDVLRKLATGFHAMGNPGKAFSYYSIIARDYPVLVAGDYKIRKEIKKVEKELRKSESILPLNVNLQQLKLILVVVPLIAFAVIFINWILSNYQRIHLVNQLSAPATVTIPGYDPIVVKAESKTTMRISEGEHDVTVEVKDALKETYHVEISNKWLDRFITDDHFIVNVGRGAIIIWEKVLYSEKPDPGLRNPYTLIVGRPFIKHDEVDYLFRDFPDSVTVKGGPEWRSRLRVLKEKPIQLAAWALREKVATTDILSFLEAHLSVAPDNDTMLQIYVALCRGGAETDRGSEFLSKGLDRRPVGLNWHINFQDLKMLGEKRNEVFTLYQNMLRKEPGNSHLLFLRGRLEPTLEQTFVYYDRAIAANANNGYIHFSKAYLFFTRSRFKEALECCVEALKKNPADFQYADLYYGLQLALGRPGKAEPMVAASFSASPWEWEFFRQLMEINALKKNSTGMQAVLNGYIGAVAKKYPKEKEQLSSRGKLLHTYLQKDFNAYATVAETFKNMDNYSSLLEILYLNRGELEKAETLPQVKDSDSGYKSLLFWLAWREKGNKEKAEHWLAKARENFLASRGDDNWVAQWLAEKPKDILGKLSELEIQPELKAILYTAFARLCPKERSKLLKEAKRMNYLPRFPYHFLNKIIRNR